MWSGTGCRTKKAFPCKSFQKKSKVFRYSVLMFQALKLVRPITDILFRTGKPEYVSFELSAP